MTPPIKMQLELALEKFLTDVKSGEISPISGSIKLKLALRRHLSSDAALDVIEKLK